MKSGRLLLGFIVSFMLFSLPVASAQIQTEFNGGFEATDPALNQFGSNGLLGCQAGTKAVSRPTGWNITSFNQSGAETSATLDNAKLVGDQVTEGSFALQLWRIPSDKCEVNIDAPTTINNNSNSILVVAESPPIKLDSPRFNLQFDASIPNQYPVKCDSEGFICGVSAQHYGNTCLGTVSNDALTFAECLVSTPQGLPQVILGGLQVEVKYNTTVSNSTVLNSVISSADFATSSLPNEAEFIRFSVDLRQVLPSNVDTVFIRFKTRETDSINQQVNSFVIDDVKLISNELPESPADSYIADMTTLTNFPLTFESVMCSGSCSAADFPDSPNVKISRRFDGVAVMNLTTRFTPTGSINQAVPTGTPSFNINTKDNTGGISVFNGSGRTARFTPNEQYWSVPLFDIDNIDNVTASGSWDYFSGGGGDVTITWLVKFNPQLKEVRQTFNPATITNERETLNGLSSLYPVIAYDNELLTNGTHLYKLFNFADKSFTANVLFELRSSGGQLLDIATDDVSVAAFSSKDAVNDWVTDQTLATDDVITVLFNTEDNVDFVFNGTIPFRSNTSTNFNVGVALGGIPACVNQCDPAGTGNRLVPFSASGFGSNETICSFTVVTDDAECLAEIGTPPNVTEDFNPNTAILGITGLLTGTGFEFVGFLFSPFFLIMGLFLLIGVGIEVVIKTGGGIPFVFTQLAGAIIGAIFGLYPPEATIAIIIITSGFLVWQFNKLTGFFTGNNGVN